MKKIIFIITALFLLNSNLYATGNDRSLLEKLLNRDLPGGAKSKNSQKNNSPREELKKISKKSYNECDHVDDKSLLEKIIRKDLPGGSGKKQKCIKSNRKAKLEKEKPTQTNFASNEISIYTGTFDVIDKEGDDQTSLLGIEHKNPDLFRDTPLGKISPISGAFMTGDSSIYLYTGIEGQYGIGPLKISPSFAPGYYEKGDGKDLGSVLEFKSEIKVGIDVLENSKIGYSYSHISNNDWGNKNPGTDNQQITFSKNF